MAHRVAHEKRRVCAYLVGHFVRWLGKGLAFSLKD